ncbi:MAG: hypothetical protein ABI443_07845 [Chthoniobacterales bacterium]
MAKSKSGSKKTNPPKPNQRGFQQAAFTGFQKSVGLTPGMGKQKIVQKGNRGR